jgi:ubiquitin-like modifier-activating enzyme ATG7
MEKVATELRLGCYFCNDIVSPADSLRDRTLDQMCTVTRPGGAAIAGANVVELLVSLLHQPSEGATMTTERPVLLAQKNSPATSSDDSATFSIVPHQIRGCINSFSQVLYVLLGIPSFMHF